MAKSTLSTADLIRGEYYTDTLFAARFTFKYNEGRKFVCGEHHKLICNALDDVYSGKIKRLMINVFPRSSKTEISVKTFIAKGLAINPKSKFIHLSYSAELALENSERVRDTITSDWYQELFTDVKIKRDSKSKKKWGTDCGGGVYATSTGGQITGFGAGLVDEEDGPEDEEINEDEEFEELNSKYSQGITKFSGAIIIDDPLKADDANSHNVRTKVNERFDSTIRSRTNSRNTPIIIIGQRLHRNDLFGYLLETEGRVEDGGVWHVLELPALIEEETGLRSLWPFKFTVPELLKLKQINKYVFSTQYQQKPLSINEKRWAFMFDPERHVGKPVRNMKEPIYLSFDFNRNPLVCSVYQHYGKKVYVLDLIRIEDATTSMVARAVKAKYPHALFFVTGDASGKTKTTLSQLNNFDVIKLELGLGKSQMQYHGANPGLSDSRYFVNAVLEQYDIEIHKDNCKPLIFDLENVLSDDENKPIKESRNKKEQQADCLDTLRYFLHRYLSDFHKHTQIN